MKAKKSCPSVAALRQAEVEPDSGTRIRGIRFGFYHFAAAFASPANLVDGGGLYGK